MSLMRRCVGMVAGLWTLGSATAAAAEALSLPLGADQLERYVAAHPEATVDSLLADLPPSMHESFVLVHKSRSMQIGRAHV